MKVTLTRSGDLDPCADFFRTGDSREARLLRERRGARPRGAGSGRRPRSSTAAGRSTYAGSARTCDARGVRRLMVEGGGTVHTQFLTADLADELQLVVAPFFVGDSRASRFVGDGRFPFNPGRRARLAEVRPIGDVVLLRYALSVPLRPGPDRGERMNTQTADRDRSGPSWSSRWSSATASPPTPACSPSTAWSTAGSTWPSASGTGVSPCAAAERRPATGPAAQRVPDRRRLRQPALRLRPAAARGGRADLRHRRLPALPAPGGTRDRALPRSWTPTCCRTTASTPTRPTSLSAARRTRATTRPRPRCSVPWANRGSTCSATTPTRPRSSRRSASTIAERVPTMVHLSPSNGRYLAAKALHGSHSLDGVL